MHQLGRSGILAGLLAVFLGRLREGFGTCLVNVLIRENLLSKGVNRPFGPF